MTTAQVVETSVSVSNNSPVQDYVHPDNQTQLTFEIVLILHYLLLQLRNNLFYQLAQYWPPE